MEHIIKAEDLPEKERVYLRKGRFGYSVVHPRKNEDGTTNWINLLIGGWGNFFKLLFILLVIFLFLYGVREMMEGCNDLAANPCKYTDLDCSIQNPRTGFGLEPFGGEESGQQQGG